MRVEHVRSRARRAGCALHPVDVGVELRHVDLDSSENMPRQLRLFDSRLRHERLDRMNPSAVVAECAGLVLQSAA